jgi:hypothetical protein
MSSSPRFGPTWHVPSHYGYPGAIEMMGSVAGPLLAGFGIALMGLIVTGSKSMRYPDVALLLLALGSVLFILVVQFTFWARLYAATPNSLTEWWPDFETDADRRAMVRREQWSARRNFELWANRARRAYRAGILSLFLGVAVVLYPGGHVSPLRWAAIGTMLGGVVYELIWIWASSIRNLEGGRSPWSQLAYRIAPELSDDPPDVR